MKKLTKLGLRKKLDKLVSEIVRSRGKCEHCGKQDGLQNAHIFPRTFMNTRFDLENCLALCLRCHLYWAHKNPIDFTEWVKEYLGEEKYELLKEKHNQITKYTLEDLQIKYQVLQDLLKTLG